MRLTILCGYASGDMIHACVFSAHDTFQSLYEECLTGTQSAQKLARWRENRDLALPKILLPTRLVVVVPPPGERPFGGARGECCFLTQLLHGQRWLESRPGPYSLRARLITKILSLFFCWPCIDFSTASNSLSVVSVNLSTIISRKVG